jgi:hypothetical protein
MQRPASGPENEFFRFLGIYFINIELILSDFFFTHGLRILYIYYYWLISKIKILFDSKHVTRQTRAARTRPMQDTEYMKHAYGFNNRIIYLIVHWSWGVSRDILLDFYLLNLMVIYWLQKLLIKLGLCWFIYLYKVFISIKLDPSRIVFNI